METRYAQRQSSRPAPARQAAWRRMAHGAPDGQVETWQVWRPAPQADRVHGMFGGPACVFAHGHFALGRGGRPNCWDIAGYATSGLEPDTRLVSQPYGQRTRRHPRAAAATPMAIRVPDPANPGISVLLTEQRDSCFAPSFSRCSSVPSRLDENWRAADKLWRFHRRPSTRKAASSSA